MSDTDYTVKTGVYTIAFKVHFLLWCICPPKVYPYINGCCSNRGGVFHTPFKNCINAHPLFNGVASTLVHTFSTLCIDAAVVFAVI